MGVGGVVPPCGVEFEGDVVGEGLSLFIASRSRETWEEELYLLLASKSGGIWVKEGSPSSWH